MYITMQPGAASLDIAAVLHYVEILGRHVHLSQSQGQTTIAVVGEGLPIDLEQVKAMAGVQHVEPKSRPFALAAHDFRQEDAIVSIDGVQVGGKPIVVMAGPCSVESLDQLMETAFAVKEAGATVLRGGAFKPRTSPYSFQGLGERGLEMLAEARARTGLLIVTEVMSPEQMPLVAACADILQIGARNMQNYALLHAAGEAHKPVLLKRGMMSTMEELLMSAEYILSHGNQRVMLCERGIRTFETYTRNTLDINAVPVLQQLSPLPVIVDPSHGAGRWDLVTATARAAIAAGADGLIIEVHSHPEKALSDGGQSLKPEKFAQMMREVRRVAEAVDRTL